jgi:hypothetical protein
MGKAPFTVKPQNSQAPSARGGVDSAAWSRRLAAGVTAGACRRGAMSGWENEFGEPRDAEINQEDCWEVISAYFDEKGLVRQQVSLLRTWPPPRWPHVELCHGVACVVSRHRSTQFAPLRLKPCAAMACRVSLASAVRLPTSTPHKHSPARR